MNRPATVVVTLELEATDTSIAGRLIDQDHHEELFTGWLGLTHALTALLAAGRDRPTHPDSRRPQ